MRSMRKSVGIILILAFAVGIAALVIDRRSADIVVGSKHFTEQKILGEIISQLIERRTKLKVRRRLGLQGTKVAFVAIREGNLDIYPEYTGTALVNILERKYDPNQSGEQILAYVRARFRDKWGISFLEPMGFGNTYAFAMREQHARKLSIEKVSDLERYAAELRLGFDHEFTTRPEHERFEEIYGFTFSKDAIKLDPDLAYKALFNSSVDVIDAFSTDGRIAAYNIRVLEDDKNLFPPYDACVVVRDEILSEYPELKTLLAELGGLISEKAMQQMNYAVTEELRAPASVASKFLVSRRLVPQTADSDD